MVPIGTEIVRTETIYHEPSLERIDYVATSYRCPNFLKESETVIVKDRCKPALIQGSYVSSSLATHVMYAKYMMANPLYRQEQDFLHLGAKIGRGTMANWIIRCSQDYLVHMFNYLHKKLLERHYLMADELCEASHNSSQWMMSRSSSFLRRCSTNGMRWSSLLRIIQFAIVARLRPIPICSQSFSCL